MNDSAARKGAKLKIRNQGTVSRIKLALLEQQAFAGERQGQDPYNTTNARPQDQWRGNARRI